MNLETVEKRLDGSFVIVRGGSPYHVPNEGEFAGLWAEVNAWSAEHPAQVTLEPPPPEPSPAELAAQRRAEIKFELDRIDAASIRPQRAVSAGTSTDDDLARLAELEAQAQTLRAELEAAEGGAI